MLWTNEISRDLGFKLCFGRMSYIAQAPGFIYNLKNVVLVVYTWCIYILWHFAWIRYNFYGIKTLNLTVRIVRWCSGRGRDLIVGVDIWNQKLYPVNDIPIYKHVVICQKRAWTRSMSLVSSGSCPFMAHWIFHPITTLCNLENTTVCSGCTCMYARLIPGLRPANARRRYFVTSSLIGREQA